LDEREAIQRWVDTKLEAIRHPEIREAESLKVLATLESAFNHAARTLPPRQSSGMGEMQYWFSRANRSVTVAAPIRGARKRD
jgi:hypothetical protein